MYSGTDTFLLSLPPVPPSSSSSFLNAGQGVGIRDDIAGGAGAVAGWGGAMTGPGVENQQAASRDDTATSVDAVEGE